MREDNGVFRDFNYYIIKIAEMSIVLADYLQRKACARHGRAHLPRQLLAELLQAPCEAEALPSSMNTKLYAQTKMLNYTVRGHLCSRTFMPAVSYQCNLGHEVSAHIQGDWTAEPSD